jgi:pimeloyl-ACP methyl ester carboxylesterase
MLLLFLAVFLAAQAQVPFKVIVKGKGEPILLFPGFGCSGDVWNETVAVLSQKYECHIFTFAGFGDVASIPTPWLSTIKAGIVNYVKDKKLNKPTLLGHSLGGTLSLWLVATEKETFKKAIIVDALPAMAAVMIPNYKGENIPYDTPQSKVLLGMDSTAFTTMSAQIVKTMCLNQEKHSTLLNWMKRADRKTYVYGYIDLLNLDLRTAIAAIKTPVVVLAATYPDLAAVQKTYNAQFEKLPSAQIYYADHSAHFIMYDQPTWFINKVKEAMH